MRNAVNNVSDVLNAFMPNSTIDSTASSLAVSCPPTEQLKPRDARICQLIASGSTMTECASSLDTTINTIRATIAKEHCASYIKQLQSQLKAQAQAQGIISITQRKQILSRIVTSSLEDAVKHNLTIATVNGKGEVTHKQLDKLKALEMLNKLDDAYSSADDNTIDITLSQSWINQDE